MKFSSIFSALLLIMLNCSMSFANDIIKKGSVGGEDSRDEYNKKGVFCIDHNDDESDDPICYLLLSGQPSPEDGSKKASFQIQKHYEQKLIFNGKIVSDLEDYNTNVAPEKDPYAFIRQVLKLKDADEDKNTTGISFDIHEMLEKLVEQGVSELFIRYPAVEIKSFNAPIISNTEIPFVTQIFLKHDTFKYLTARYAVISFGKLTPQFIVDNLKAPGTAAVENEPVSLQQYTSQLSSEQIFELKNQFRLNKWAFSQGDKNESHYIRQARAYLSDMAAMEDSEIGELLELIIEPSMKFFISNSPWFQNIPPQVEDTEPLKLK
ncbi:MAG: hypothetical protein HOO06_07670 [Bdellovibrionaceae bacterium]|mgnify:CR=1 FL=1|jgi:hypothetical protein|nr:hypothetical protein [Pseudobdellovibrionaceae bacterium]